jgi:hypothetical protein
MNKEIVNSSDIDVLATNDTNREEINNEKEKSFPLKTCYFCLCIFESIGECLISCLGLDDSIYENQINNMTEKELKYAQEVQEKRERENKVLSEYNSPLITTNEEYKEDNDEENNGNINKNVNTIDNSNAVTIDNDFDLIKIENKQDNNSTTLDTIPLVSKDNINDQIDNKISNEEELNDNVDVNDDEYVNINDNDAFIENN